MKRFAASLFALSLLALPGCLYANTKLPLDTDLNQTKLGAKTGEASAFSILWLVAWGDASTQAAAEQGKITQINHADQANLLILFGVFSRYTTIVYGD
jgi:hypothetical protein